MLYNYFFKKVVVHSQVILLCWDSGFDSQYQEHTETINYNQEMVWMAVSLELGVSGYMFNVVRRMSTPSV